MTETGNTSANENHSNSSLNEIGNLTTDGTHSNEPSVPVSNNTFTSRTISLNAQQYNNFSTEIPLLSNHVSKVSLFVNVTPYLNFTYPSQNMSDSSSTSNIQTNMTSSDNTQIISTLQANRTFTTEQMQDNHSSFTYQRSNSGNSIVHATTESTLDNKVTTAKSELKSTSTDVSLFKNFTQDRSATNNTNTFTGIYLTAQVSTNLSIAEKNNSSPPQLSQNYNDPTDTTTTKRTSLALTVSPQFALNNSLNITTGDRTSYSNATTVSPRPSNNTTSTKPLQFVNATVNIPASNNTLLSTTFLLNTLIDTNLATGTPSIKNSSSKTFVSSTLDPYITVLIENMNKSLPMVAVPTNTSSGNNNQLFTISSTPKLVQNNSASMIYHASTASNSFVKAETKSTQDNKAVTATSELNATFLNENIFMNFTQNFSAMNNEHAFTGVLSMAPVVTNMTISEKNSSFSPQLSQMYGDSMTRTSQNQTFLVTTLPPHIAMNNSFNTTASVLSVNLTYSSNDPNASPKPSYITSETKPIQNVNITSSNITILDTTFHFNVTKKNNFSTDPSSMNNYSLRTFTSSVLNSNITILTQNMINITPTAALVPDNNSSEATQGRNETAHVATVPIISANYNNSPTVTIKSNVTLKNVSANMNMTPHPSQSHNISNGISTTNNTIPGITVLHNFTLYNNFTTNSPALNETITNRTYIVNITLNGNGTVVTQTMNANTTASATYQGSNDNNSYVTITAKSTPGNKVVTAASELKGKLLGCQHFHEFHSESQCLEQCIRLHWYILNCASRHQCDNSKKE